MDAIRKFIFGEDKRLCILLDTKFTSPGCQWLFGGLMAGSFRAPMVPNIGFAVEEAEYKCLRIHRLCEVRFLRHFVDQVKGVIVVVDCTDDATTAVEAALNDDQFGDCSVLIYVIQTNSLYSTATTEEMIRRVNLDNVNDRKWHVTKLPDLTGEGVYEGLDWLVEATQDSAPWKWNLFGRFFHFLSSFRM